MLRLNRHDPDVETGCANVQITECAVWLLHSRPIQLPDEYQTGSTPFRGSKDDRNVRRVLELRPRVCLQLGRDESCFREPRLRRSSRQFPRYVNLGTSRGEAYKLLNARKLIPETKLTVVLNYRKIKISCFAWNRRGGRVEQGIASGCHVPENAIRLSRRDTVC